VTSLLHYKDSESVLVTFLSYLNWFNLATNY